MISVRHICEYFVLKLILHILDKYIFKTCNASVYYITLYFHYLDDVTERGSW